MNRADRPIGVFDSGVGGLTVGAGAPAPPAWGIHRLPVGDTARVPYGSKSPETVAKYAIQAGEILQRFDPKLLVIALQHGLCPGAGGSPGRESLSGSWGDRTGGRGRSKGFQGPSVSSAPWPRSRAGHTIRPSGSRRPDAVIHSLACPLLVSPGRRRGWLDDPITDSVCRRYSEPAPLRGEDPHPGLHPLPSAPAPPSCGVRPDTTWIDSGEVTARSVDRLLQGSLGFRTASARGPLKILLTDAGSRLKEIGRTLPGRDPGGRGTGGGCKFGPDAWIGESACDV